ncbi:MAG: cytosine methyltransferase [Phenylobacterium sp.]|nr:cytosine methyltransferase [Phenylobacterium sp.]
MRALDLYGGAGLVADGLKAAGFEPWGVDLTFQRSYPGPFIQHDALTLDERLLDAFPAIWASPPCKKDTPLHASARREERAHGRAEKLHPDLITPTRVILQRWAARTGGKYVIENVATAPLLNPVILCGSMFGLGVTDAGRRFHLERHRKFETNWPLTPPGPCRHQRPVVSIAGGHARNRSAADGGRQKRGSWERPHPEIMRLAMGLERQLTGGEIDQGIPPAYAEWVGVQLAREVRNIRKAA